jgi:hypothetical protein
LYALLTHMVRLSPTPPALTSDERLLDASQARSSQASSTLKLGRTKAMASM